MILRLLAYFLALAFMFCALVGEALAAERLLMKNGDRLTGEIVRMEEGLLIFKASFSDDKINVEWSSVSCIESDRDLTVVFKDNEMLIGRISCPSAERMQMSSLKLGPTREFALDDIQSVNPGTYRGYLNFGGSLARGNTETSAANLSTRFVAKTHRHRLTVEGKFNYAESEGSTSARNSLGSLKYDFFQTKKLYNYAQFLTERDDFANLNLRLTQGLGVGYQFYDTRKLRLFIEAGISYYNADMNQGDDSKGASARWAAGVEYEATPKWLQLYHRQEGYYTPDSGSVYIRAEQGFRVPLRDRLGVFLETDYRFNSQPEADKGSSDLFLIMGLSYEYAYW